MIDVMVMGAMVAAAPMATVAMTDTSIATTLVMRPSTAAMSLPSGDFGKSELFVPGPSFALLACLKQGPCNHGAVSLQKDPEVDELCFQVR